MFSRFMKNAPVAVAALAFVLLQACSSLPDKLIWKNDDTGEQQATKSKNVGKGIVPEGLRHGPTTPITPEDAKRTAMSRAKVVDIQEPGKNRTEKKYFDLVDERSSVTLAPVIDKSARPVRIVTYDNNSMAKDFRMRFGVIWGRTIEALMEIPLQTVDRSSGIIVTDWVVDTAGATSGFLNMQSAGKRVVRYKYTIHIIDRGSMTRIKVIPFTQTLNDRKWMPAKPGLVVTTRMFNRIELELGVPLASERD